MSPGSGRSLSALISTTRYRVSPCRSVGDKGPAGAKTLGLRLLGVVIVAFAAIWILGAIFSLFEAAQGKEVSGMKNGLTLAVAAWVALTSQASAQDADIGAGAAYAKKVCAACHAVLANEQLAPAAGSDLPVGRRHAGDDGDGARGLAAKLPPRENHAQYRARARRLAERCRLYSQPRSRIGVSDDLGCASIVAIP